MKLHRIFALALALVLALTAAASADVVLNEVGVRPVVSEGEVALTIAIKDNPDVIWENNWMTGYYSELLGGSVTPDVWPATDAESKLTLMVNSGAELPDVLTFGATDWATRNQYADAGALYCLDEYFEESNPISALFYKRCEEVGLDPAIVLGQVRSLDNSLYAFPIYDMKIPNIYANRAYINKDFLSALNMEAPTTIDELTAYLKAVRDMDPNGNGIADEIPMTGNNDFNNNGNALVWLQNMFCYCDGSANRFNRLDKSNGDLEYTFDTEEYREFLKYVNMLVAEGLLDQASFSQDTTTMRKGLQADVQTVGMMCGSANGFGPNIASWEPIEQPTGFYGEKQVTYWQQSISGSFIITSSCENPEAAVRLAMLGYDGDEMGLIERYGEPNVDWRYGEEGEMSVFKEMGLAAHIVCLNVTWATVSDKSWQLSTVFPYMADASTHIEAFDGNEVYGERYHGRSVGMNYTYAPDSKYAPSQILYTEEEQDEWSDARTALQSYVAETTARFAIGQLDPNSDADWEAYLAELENLQYKELLEVANNAYTRMYGEIVID